jgi:hypothetical protein
VEVVPWEAEVVIVEVVPGEAEAAAVEDVNIPLFKNYIESF